jgi:hypothetical protein
VCGTAYGTIPSWAVRPRPPASQRVTRHEAGVTDQQGFARGQAFRLFQDRPLSQTGEDDVAHAFLREEIVYELVKVRQGVAAYSQHMGEDRMV